MNKFGHGGYASFAIGCFWFFLGNYILKSPERG